jgi:uncharacterized protein YndB with AHSA1/START domain
MPVLRSSSGQALEKETSMTDAAGTNPIAARELSLTRTIDAPRDLVFKAWTDPESLTQWWGPHGVTTPVCEMDLRPGGIFRTVVRMPDGTEYPHQGVFLEIVKPERIVFTDAFEDAWTPSGKAFMTVIVSFENQDDKTRYTARVLHWSAADREAHEQMGFHKGWGESADRFEAVVAALRSALQR